MFSLNYLLSKLIKGQEKNQLIIEIKKISKLIFQVLDILVKEGFINGYIIKNEKVFVYLKYYNRKPLINKFFFLSKPSLRVYFTNKDLKAFFTKRGKNLILIISTPKGLMTGEQALYKNLGGEPLFFLT